MVVEVNLRLRRDEDFEFLRLGDIVVHLVIERMDPFDDDGLARANFQDSSRDAVSDFEIEFRKLNLFPGDEVEHILVE